MVKRRIAKTNDLGFDSPLELFLDFGFITLSYTLKNKTLIYFFIDDPAYILSPFFNYLSASISYCFWTLIYSLTVNSTAVLTVNSSVTVLDT